MPESIENFVEGFNFEGFTKDDKTVSAVIGEAAKQIPEEIKQKYPQAPWKEMAGMRDRRIHSYFGVDQELVWTTIKYRIPQVKPALKEILG